MDKATIKRLQDLPHVMKTSVQSSVRLDKSNTMLFRFVQSSFSQICPAYNHFKGVTSGRGGAECVSVGT